MGISLYQSRKRLSVSVRVSDGCLVIRLAKIPSSSCVRTCLRRRSRHGFVHLYRRSNYKQDSILVTNYDNSITPAQMAIVSRGLVPLPPRAVSDRRTKYRTAPENAVYRKYATIGGASSSNTSPLSFRHLTHCPGPCTGCAGVSWKG